MAQKVFINYKDEVKSFEINEKHVGMFKPGRYAGFDTMQTAGGMNITIGHSGRLRKTLKDATEELNFGSCLLPSGNILHENESIPLVVAVNSGNANPRIDWVIVEHLYEEVVNGTPAVYSIIQGPMNGTEPSLVDASKQILLGKVTIVPNGDEFTDLSYEKAEVPTLGDNTLEEFYNVFQHLVQADVDEAFNNIPISSFGQRGLIALATQEEVETGTDPAKAITSATLKKYIDTKNYVRDANYVHSDVNFTTARAVKLDGLTEGGEPNVQIDWLSESGMTSIANKPVIVQVLKQGTVLIGDISAEYVGKQLTCAGGILSAEVLEDGSDDTLIQVNFASVGSTNYHPIITLRGYGNWHRDSEISFSVKDFSNGSFKIGLREAFGEVQNLTAIITIIALTV